METLNVKEMVAMYIADPSKENFDKIKDNDLVFSLIYEQLEDKSFLIDHIQTFEEWKDVYYRFDGELEKLAVQKMSEFEKTFEEWKGLVFQKMLKIIKSN